MQDYYISELLEIKQKGIIITKLFTEKKIRHIHLEIEMSEHTCPRCGTNTAAAEKVHLSSSFISALKLAMLSLSLYVWYK